MTDDPTATAPPEPTPPADPPPAADGGRAPGRLPLGPIAVVLVAALAASLAWGLSQRGDADDLRAEAGERREALLAATGFVEALLTYDHQDLDAQQKDLDPFLSEGFRAEFTDALIERVHQEIRDQEATSTVEIQDAYISLDRRDDVTVIVHAISEIASGGGEAGAAVELEAYLRVALVRADGFWRVDDLVSLGSRDLSPPLDAGQADPATDPADDPTTDPAAEEES